MPSFEGCDHLQGHLGEACEVALGQVEVLSEPFEQLSVGSGGGVGGDHVDRGSVVDLAGGGAPRSRKGGGAKALILAREIDRLLG